MEGGDQLAFAQRERVSEGTVVGGESRDQRVITSGGGGGGQVGNGVDSFLSIDMFGGVVARTGGGGL